MSDTQFDAGPIGGQALVEGVMMRRGECWGAAVRRADGTIATVSRDLPASLNAWRNVPGVRGCLSLAEGVGLGTKATTWAARERLPEDEGGVTRRGIALSLIVAVGFAVGVFTLLPAALASALGPKNALGFNLVEGFVRLGLLLGYLLLLSRSAGIRRVFAYHGAEHMTIHAFEHGVPLEPARIRAFDRRHPRCGTSFLIVVVIMTVFVFSLVGRPPLPLLLLSRLLLLPVVAGLAYELIRFAGKHQDQLVGRILMVPGSLLQSITTREPDDDQIEVAIAALLATVREPAAVMS